ncbi:MAG: MobA/MobL family protein [Carnobacterium alterfunditum]
MASFHMKVKNISKHKQSAVAKAAYVTNESLFSERDDETKKYKKRDIQPESFILAPTHAPSFVKEREQLWNEAEKIEKQYNARVMREIVVALPVELNDELQTELTKRFVNEVLVSDGMVADVSIHRDQKHNPHAHILLTVRPFELDGSWASSKSKKEYILDEKGNKVLNDSGKYKTRNVDLTGWSTKETLLKWRESFAQLTNEFYNQNGINQKVSHLSYEEQGLDKLPKQRTTRSEYYIEKNEKKNAEKENREYVPVTYYGKLNEQIDEYNKELEMIEAKIISLEEVKERNIPVNVQEFHNIRKEMFVSTDNEEAIRFVMNREKVESVDYSVARKTMDSIEFWKKSIDRKNRKSEREKNVLETAVEHYKGYSKNLYKLGFVRENFAEQYNPRAVLLDNNYKKLAREFEGYHDAFSFANKTLEHEKNVLRKEFVYLYPQYKEVAINDTLEVNEIMYKYVNDFRENKNLHNHINEFEHNELSTTTSELTFRSDVRNAVTNYRIESKQHFSLTKQLERAEEQYKVALNLHKDTLNTSDESKVEIYKAAVNYLSVKNELAHLTSSYELTKNTIYSSLLELYGKEQEGVIKELPDRVKVNLLESYLEERTVNELHDDLSEVKWNMNKEWERKDQESSNDNFEENGSSTKALGNILSDLIDQAHKNSSSTSDESKLQRAKRKRKKLIKEDLLELE